MPPPLLFDLDGTLVDSLADIATSANYLRAEFGLPQVPFEVARGWVGDGVVALMQRCLAELGEFEPRRKRATELYMAHHFAQCTMLVRPYAGVVEHLERWHGEGRRMAVVTNKPERFAARILEHLGLAGWFDAGVYGDSLDVRKPDPAPVREALRRLGARLDQGTMVGDSVQDLRAGKAAGLHTVAALFGFHSEARLRDEGADQYWREFGIPTR